MSRTIVGAKTVLSDQTLNSFIWAFTVALPYLYKKFGHPLQLVQKIIMDDNSEQIRAVKIAVQKAVFASTLVIASCNFHKLTLGLRKSGHCAGAELKISQSILNTLWFIALRCCYPDEVQQGMQLLKQRVQQFARDGDLTESAAIGTLYFFEKLIEDPSIWYIAYHPTIFDGGVTTTSNWKVNTAPCVIAMEGLYLEFQDWPVIYRARKMFGKIENGKPHLRCFDVNQPNLGVCPLVLKQMTLLSKLSRQKV